MQFKSKELGSLFNELKEQGAIKIEEKQKQNTPVIVTLAPIETVLELTEEFVPETIPVIKKMTTDLSKLKTVDNVDTDEILNDEDIIESRDFTLEEKILDSYNKLYIAISRVGDRLDRIESILANIPLNVQRSTNHIETAINKSFSANVTPAEVANTQIHHGRNAYKNMPPTNTSGPMSAEQAFAMLEEVDPDTSSARISNTINYARPTPPPTPTRSTTPASLLPASRANNAPTRDFDFSIDL